MEIPTKEGGCFKLSWAFQLELCAEFIDARAHLAQLQDHLARNPDQRPTAARAAGYVGRWLRQHAPRRRRAYQLHTDVAEFAPTPEQCANAKAHLTAIRNVIRRAQRCGD